MKITITEVPKSRRRFSDLNVGDMFTIGSTGGVFLKLADRGGENTACIRPSEGGITSPGTLVVVASSATVRRVEELHLTVEA